MSDLVRVKNAYGWQTVESSIITLEGTFAYGDPGIDDPSVGAPIGFETQAGDIVLQATVVLDTPITGTDAATADAFLGVPPLTGEGEYYAYANNADPYQTPNSSTRVSSFGPVVMAFASDLDESPVSVDGGSGRWRIVIQRLGALPETP